MKLIKKVLSIICIFLISCIVCGCFNYREINKITFATSIIFDKDEYDNVKIYLDCVRPYRNENESSDKGRRLIFESTGKTVLEAIRGINLMSSNEVNFSQVKSYIFTENVAKSGIEDYTNLINNNQQFSFKPYMFVYFGDVDALLDMVGNEEEYIGIYLQELIETNKENGSVIYKNVNDYLCEILENDRVSYMTGIELRKDDVDNKIKLNGGVIMKDNIMVDKIEPSDVVSCNLLLGKANKGTFEVVNPDQSDKFVTLDILESSTDTEIYIDDRINIKKNIEIIATIGEIQGTMTVNNKKIKQMEIIEEEKLKDYLMEVFNQYKDEEIDILKIKRLIKTRYPYYNEDNILKNVNMNINVRVKIEGSSLVRESL